VQSPETKIIKKQNNWFVKKMSKRNQTIVEPVNVVAGKQKWYEVAKETKYGIAKEYGISVKELERQNPKLLGSSSRL
jgi:LysM repeat protein